MEVEEPAAAAMLIHTITLHLVKEFLANLGRTLQQMIFLLTYSPLGNYLA